MGSSSICSFRSGAATFSRGWLFTTGDHLVSAAAYDGFGNRTSATTTLCHGTDFLCDATYHVIPIESRDPLYVDGDTRHKTTALWGSVGSYVYSDPINWRHQLVAKKARAYGSSQTLLVEAI